MNTQDIPPLSKDSPVVLEMSNISLWCPKCGKALTKRAVRCPSCKKLVPLVGHGQVPPTCPSCGKGLSMAPNADGPICPGG